MPDIDVTDVILDPMFSGGLVVYRRVETLVKGRTTVVPTLVAPAPIGSMQALSDSGLQRAPDQQQMPRRIEVFTPYLLRGASKSTDDTQQFQPDVVMFNGDPFAVFEIEDWSQYGDGWIRAVCVATDPIDNEPT